MNLKLEKKYFHLQHARMPSEEILLFIENIKQYVNSLYEEHPELHI